MGPPGSGKGTQSDLLKKYLKINVISIGDILRNEVRLKTEVGLKIKNIIENGLLINDDILFSLIKNDLINNDNFILDGMPRTLNQSFLFESMNINFDFLINIKVDNLLLIKRIKYRLICEISKKVYNIIYNKPKIKNLDDISGQILTLRKDDVYSIVVKRLNIYNENSNKIVDFYKNKNIKIFNIDGNDDIKNVFLKIKSCL